MRYQYGECRVINVNHNAERQNIALIDLDKTCYISDWAKNELGSSPIYGDSIAMHGENLELWPQNKFFVDISKDDISMFSKKCREIAADANICVKIFGSLSLGILNDLTSSYRMIDSFLLAVNGVKSWRFVYYWD